MVHRVLVIGIGGGSGSGKSSLARRIAEAVGPTVATVLELDSYYHNYAQVPLREREKMNYDHPDAIDWDTLIGQLEALRQGERIEQPVYDFTTHERRDEVVEVSPTPVVIVEGIHCLTRPALRELLDISIFVDTDPDVRFIRRLRRDILDRDRTIDSVVNQYMETVRPMYIEFVEPSRRYADIVLPEAGGKNQLGVEMVIEALVRRIERLTDEEQPALDN